MQQQDTILEEAKRRLVLELMPSEAHPHTFGKTHDLERLVRLAASIDHEFRTLSDSGERIPAVDGYSTVRSMTSLIDVASMTGPA